MRLPGNRDAVSHVALLDDGLVVKADRQVWSWPDVSLSGAGMKVRRSWTFVPSSDGQTVWVDPDGADRSSTLVGIDSSGIERRQLRLPDGCVLVAEGPYGCAVRDGEHGVGCVAAGDSTVHWLRPDENVTVVAAHPQGVAFKGAGISSVLFVADLSTGALHGIERPEIAEWQSVGAFSPDGSRLAIGGFSERGDLHAMNHKAIVRGFGGPYAGRPSRMVVIDTETGSSAVVAGEFDNFAYAPVWCRDRDLVVFGAPFERRQLRGFGTAEMVLHTWSFRNDPAMPMAEITS